MLAPTLQAWKSVAGETDKGLRDNNQIPFSGARQYLEPLYSAFPLPLQHFGHRLLYRVFSLRSQHLRFFSRQVFIHKAQW
jgi:hypothetical protein